MSDGLRFYATGTCDGYGELVAALGGYAGLELVGQSAEVRGASALCPAATSTSSCMRPAGRCSRRTSTRRSASTRRRP